MGMKPLNGLIDERFMGLYSRITGRLDRIVNVWRSIHGRIQDRSLGILFLVEDKE